MGMGMGMDGRWVGRESVPMQSIYPPCNLPPATYPCSYPCNYPCYYPCYCPCHHNSQWPTQSTALQFIYKSVQDVQDGILRTTCLRRNRIYIYTQHPSTPKAYV